MSDGFRFRRLAFDPNRVIFEEGAPGDAAYFITDGKVEIRKAMHGALPKKVGICDKGDVFGEMALVSGERRMATTVAMTRTEVIAISRDEFHRRLQAMDPIMRTILLVMIDRLHPSSTSLFKNRPEVDWRRWRRDI